MSQTNALDAHFFNVSEPIAEYVKDKGDVRLTKEIIQSALCEAIDRTNLATIYNDVVLSPEENRKAATLSRYFEKYVFRMLSTNLPPGQNGLIDIHTVKMASVYGALLIQRLDDV